MTYLKMYTNFTTSAVHNQISLTHKGIKRISYTNSVELIQNYKIVFHVVKYMYYDRCTFSASV